MSMTYGIKTDKCVYIIQFFPFLIKKLIFWIVGVVGGYAKKYPTRKAHIPRELVLLLWAKKIAQTPNYLDMAL
jgi:hypothetical protein